jgi:DNA invertase Pin-like site-specific DNA recombinase
LNLDAGFENLHSFHFSSLILLESDRRSRQIFTKTVEVVMPFSPRLTVKPSNRAAQYVRMSTELQQYSSENQAEVIKRFAASHGLEIVKMYADHGRSGLNLSGRDGLQQLLQDVENGAADFSAVLVYDVSRWGRFQDADESAYYEYFLKRFNIAVHYCAEQFENDGSLSSDLLKAVKRTMAGEYSRELSCKVFAGQCRLIEMGFRQGGAAGYGLRRQLIDRNGISKSQLNRGDRKSFQTDRVILVPGPDEEIAVVRDIYERFVRHGEAELQIASSLNHRGIVSDLRRPWTRATIHQILTNPKYVGTNVYIPLYLCADEVGSTEPVVNRESDDSARIVAPLAQ